MWRAHLLTFKTHILPPKMSFLSSQLTTLYSGIAYRLRLLRVDDRLSDGKRAALEADLEAMRRTVAEIALSARTDDEKIDALANCIYRMNVEQTGLA